MIKYNQDTRRESFDYSIKLPKKPTVYAVGFFHFLHKITLLLKIT